MKRTASQTTTLEKFVMILNVVNNGAQTTPNVQASPSIIYFVSSKIGLCLARIIYTMMEVKKHSSKEVKNYSFILKLLIASNKLLHKL